MRLLLFVLGKELALGKNIPPNPDAAGDGG